MNVRIDSSSFLEINMETLFNEFYQSFFSDFDFAINDLHKSLLQGIVNYFFIL